jgi:hypothetical protein
MIEVFVTSFSLTTLASVICWALVFATLPALRYSHPEHFAAAGKPAHVTWTLLNVSFLGYLLSGKFRTLQDQQLLAKLKILRALWLVGLVALVIMIVTALVHFGA